ncbi:MAG: zf-HC2 domain-containing protein, partial [Elusimicrobia bacterium]|nr:zf-HC2 domain-containing protein [Elusimicrobiota bacterium]
MNCETAAEELVDLAEGVLASGRAAEVEAHASSCPACAKRLRALRAAKSAFKALPPEALSPDFAARLRVRLAQEPRREGW